MHRANFRARVMGTTLDFRESIETELSASGVDRFVKTYDYSDKEWVEIAYLCNRRARVR